MSLTKAWLALQLRHRVVHRLPGRLRVHVPALKRVEPPYGPVVDALIPALARHEGVSGIEVSPTTGNLLIQYNPRALTEREVLDWLIEVRQCVADVMGRFARLDRAASERAATNLRAFLSDAAANGNKVEASSGIPESVWQ